MSPARIPRAIGEFLAQPNIAVVSTVMPSGSPHTAATWYDWEDGRVLLNMDESRRRLEYMRLNPRVALTAMQEGDWSRQVSLMGRVDLDRARYRACATSTGSPCGTPASRSSAAPAPLERVGRGRPLVRLGRDRPRGRRAAVTGPRADRPGRADEVRTFEKGRSSPGLLRAAGRTTAGWSATSRTCRSTSWAARRYAAEWCARRRPHVCTARHSPGALPPTPSRPRVVRVAQRCRGARRARARGAGIAAGDGHAHRLAAGRGRPRGRPTRRSRRSRSTRRRTRSSRRWAPAGRRRPRRARPGRPRAASRRR